MNRKTVIWLIEYLKIRLLELSAYKYRPESAGKMLTNKIESVVKELQDELNRLDKLDQTS